MPIILKHKCTTAALRAFLVVPMEESIAVTQVPIFCPKIMGMALAYVMVPVAESACKIPTEAEELWIIAVSKAPANTPKRGLLKRVKRFVKDGLSCKPTTELLIMVIPVIKTANPMKMEPVSCFLLLLQNITKTIPITAKIGEKDDGSSIFTKKLSP